MTVVGGGDRVASQDHRRVHRRNAARHADDAGFALNKLYEKFKDEFWIDYRIMVLYGCYEYNLSAAYCRSDPETISSNSPSSAWRRKHSRST